MKKAEEIYEEAKQECFSNNCQSSHVIGLVAMEKYAKLFIEEAVSLVEKESWNEDLETIPLSVLNKLSDKIEALEDLL